MMTSDPRELYLNLLKQTLAFNLWPEPPTPIENENYRRSAWRRSLIALLSKLLSLGGMGLVKKTVVTAGQREQGQIWPGYADTMIGLRRLDNIETCVKTVLSEQVPGDLIETGVWRGGACILMRAVLQAYGDASRRVFVADSFEGLPKPDLAAFPGRFG